MLIFIVYRVYTSHYTPSTFVVPPKEKKLFFTLFIEYHSNRIIIVIIHTLSTEKCE